MQQHRQKFWKVPFIVTSGRKCTRTLTFQNFPLVQPWGAPGLACLPGPSQCSARRALVSGTIFFFWNVRFGVTLNHKCTGHGLSKLQLAARQGHHKAKSTNNKKNKNWTLTLQVAACCAPRAPQGAVQPSPMLPSRHRHGAKRQRCSEAVCNGRSQRTHAGRVSASPPVPTWSKRSLNRWSVTLNR